MSDKPNELRITRFIAAPPAKVWEVMATRQNEWWCPKPWYAEVDEQDARPGGVTRMTMYGPDDEVSPQNGIFLAYDEGRRFVVTDAVVTDEDGGFAPSGPFMIGSWAIEPASEDGVEGTCYTASARHWTEETCKQHKDMGFEQGWGICADQLAEICEREAAQ